MVKIVFLDRCCCPENFQVFQSVYKDVKLREWFGVFTDMLLTQKSLQKMLVQM